MFDARGSWDSDPDAPVVEGADPVQRVLRGAARAVGVTLPGESYYLKRVIGLPGGRVACCTPDAAVTVQPPGSDR